MKEENNIKVISLDSFSRRMKEILLDMLGSTDNEIKREMILEKLNSLEESKSAC